ncbi:hypothetical protein PFISCL1PPCAC_5783, partial [Pristionchus fissidentatus]
SLSTLITANHCNVDTLDYRTPLHTPSCSPLFSSGRSLQTSDSETRKHSRRQDNQSHPFICPKCESSSSSLIDSISLLSSSYFLFPNLLNLLFEGIDAPLPKIAEYETFKQSPEANFIHDGNGKLHFRQFRRINLNSVMSQRMGI